MPYIVTTVHDPAALAATCRHLSLPPPQHGTVQLDGKEVCGWIIYLVGVRYPIVCNTLTGLIAYHPADNAFGRYSRVMRFIHRYYEIHARLRADHAQSDTRNRIAPVSRRPALAG